MDDLILVTGATGGVGSAIARHLLSQGYRNISLHCRSRVERAEALLREFDVDPEGHVVRADLTNETEVKDMHRALTDRLGPLYGLVNVAGGSTNSMSWKLSVDQFRSVIDQNLLTTFLACREFAPEMRELQRGRIINISSVVGFTGTIGAAHYCAAKAAVIGFTKALALELASKSVVTSAIALGYFESGLIETVPPAEQARVLSRIPAGRFGNAAEIGGLVDFLLSGSGAYSSGQVYHLNGGLY